jgi:hypothetical protein
MYSSNRAQAHFIQELLMMTLKTTLTALTLASAALLSQTASATDISNPVEALTFDMDGAAFFGQQFAGHNAGNTFSDKYTFSVASLTNLSADLFSYSGNAKNGLDITSLDLYTSTGTLVQHGTQLLTGATDQWTLSSNGLGASSYYLQVSGSVLSNAAGRYTGSAATAAVPEPETYGMLLGGLAILGVAARRRKQS